MFRGYPGRRVDNILKEVKHERMEALKQKLRTHKKILPFVKQFQPALPDLKNMDK